MRIDYLTFRRSDPRDSHFDASREARGSKPGSQSRGSGVQLTGTVRVAPSIVDPHWGSLRGSDFLLMMTAYQHAAINGRDMSCYEVEIIRDSKRTVAFIGDRESGDIEREGDGGSTIIERGPNPRCPNRLFEMDDAGKVVRVIEEERH